MVPRSLDVLLIAFNRPRQLARVCQALQSRSDLRVFVALDGPREASPTDKHNVEACVDVVESTLGGVVAAIRRSPVNLGCAVGATTAISWFLEQVPEGVILEDDCVPSSTFLDFASLMLARFRDDSSTAAICGVNYAPPYLLPANTIGVRSKFLMLWGWATWRRAWAGFDVHRVGVDGLDEKNKIWRSMSHLERRDWKRMIRSVSSDDPHTWDYQLLAHLWRKEQTVILPPAPLVQNIGFDSGAHYSGQTPRHYRDPDANELTSLDRLLSEREGKSVVVDGQEVDRWLSGHIWSPPLWVRAADRGKRLGRRR